MHQRDENVSKGTLLLLFSLTILVIFFPFVSKHTKKKVNYNK